MNHVDEWRAAVVIGLAPNAEDVLDLGCGYGSTCVALAQQGLRATGIDLSDRIDRAPTPNPTETRTSSDQTDWVPSAQGQQVGPNFIKGDFLTHEFEQRFDVVSYWDGFGVGADEDQLAVLDLIAGLLRPGGIGIVEVYDPIGFRDDDGLDEVKHADPSRGYEHSLRHQRSFDETTSRALDSWTEADSGMQWTQSLRCYSPADYVQLVGQSALTWRETLTEGRSAWSYVTILT